MHICLRVQCHAVTNLVAKGDVGSALSVQAKITLMSHKLEMVKMKVQALALNGHILFCKYSTYICDCSCTVISLVRCGML